MSTMDLLQNQSYFINNLYNLSCEMSSPVATWLSGESPRGQALSQERLLTAEAVALRPGSVSTQE